MASHNNDNDRSESSSEIDLDLTLEMMLAQAPTKPRTRRPPLSQLEKECRAAKHTETKLRKIAKRYEKKTTPGPLLLKKATRSEKEKK